MPLDDEPLTWGMKKINLIRQYGTIAFLVGFIMGTFSTLGSLLAFYLLDKLIR